MNARTARMIQEGSVPEGTLGATLIATFILVLVAIAMPGKHAPAPTGSLIAAQAATPQVSRMPPPAANATEGNVFDMTY